MIFTFPLPVAPGATLSVVAAGIVRSTTLAVIILATPSGAREGVTDASVMFATLTDLAGRSISAEALALRAATIEREESAGEATTAVRPCAPHLDRRRHELSGDQDDFDAARRHSFALKQPINGNGEHRLGEPLIDDEDHRLSVRVELLRLSWNQSAFKGLLSVDLADDGELIDLAAGIVARTRAGGRILLSGMLWEYTFEVRQTFGRLGCRELENHMLSEYSTTLLAAP